MKKINKVIRNQAGMNLLSVLGTMAVLGAGLVGVINLIKMSDTGQDSASRKVEATSLTSMIETKLKSVFLNTKGANGVLDTGLCEMVRVNDSTSSLSNVYLQLPNPDTTDLFSAAVWAKAFPEFTPVLSGQEGCNLTSKYGRCYKLNPSLTSNFGAAKEILIKLNPIFEINIKTMLTNPAADTTFGEVIADGMKKYDFKAISFQYTIRTIYKSRAGENNQNIGNRLIKSFVWSGDVGICQVSGRKISLTGSSLGDPDAQTTFNLPGFSTNSLSANNNPPLELFFNKSQIRSGQQTVNSALDSQFIISSEQDHPVTGPVYSACNENIYQCPQIASSNTRNYQAMRHLLKAQYQSPNILFNSGSDAVIAPHIKFKHLNGNTIQDNYYESFELSDKQIYVKGAGNDNWFYLNGNIGDPLKISGTQSIITRLIDSSSSPGANNVCREICVPTTNFNSSDTQNYNSIFTYKVKVTNPSPSQVNSFEESGGPVACTACYMKNCDQFGLGTFGAMQVQPTEPLDSGVPSCVQHESHVNNFYELPGFDLTPSNSSKCISARMNSGDLSGFSLKADTCTESKPVMCFAFGKHLLAKSVTLTSSSIIPSTFDNANDVCFNLGKENIKKLPFRTRLTQQSNLGTDEMELLGITSADQDIPENARMDVVNYITQGSFFAPVGLNQEKMLRRFAEGINGDKPDLISTNFWIGLKTDNLGYVFSPAPQLSALSLSPAVKWGIHYDGNGKMIVKKLSNSLNISNSASSALPDGAKAGLLYHHERFKGVNFGHSSKPYGEKKLRALCRKQNYPHEVFVSNSKTDSFLEAASLCKNEGGLFLPPLTTAGWEVAYQKVNADDSKHAFPVGTDFDPAWVNVIQKAGSESIHLSLLEGTLSRFIKTNGDFEAEVTLEGQDKSEQEKGSYDRACFNKDKGEIRIRQSCDSGSRKLSKDEIIAASSSENIYLRFMLKAALANNSGLSLVKLYDE
jgi:hypothetical protein